MSNALSYVHGASDKPLIGQTIGRYFDDACASNAGREALVVRHQNVRLTYAELRLKVDALACGLRRLGLEPGDRVGIWSQNNHEWTLTQFATAKAGLVLVNINPAYRRSELEYALNKVGCRALILSPSFKSSDYLAMLADLAPELAHCEPGLLRSHRLPTLEIVIRLGAGRSPGMLNFADLLAPPGRDELAELAELGERLQFDDPINIQFTSGTTGNPKGVVYHHRGAYLNAVSNIVSWGMQPHAVYLWTLPMFHCNGWCFPWTMAANAGVNVCLRRVDVNRIFELIRTLKVTHFCGAPIVHGMLINAPEAARTGIDHPVNALIAGAAPPAAIIEGMERIGFNITHVYGLTETYGPASVCAKHPEWDSLPIEQRAEMNGRQGVRYHMQEAVSVRDPITLEAVPADGETMGEVMFRGNLVMKGYLKNETASAEAFAGGWFHTGDLAVMQPDGYIKIKDRSKDVIISGGENISSIEVEDVLYRHPAVSAAAVIAMPDPKWGEVPCAFLELKDGAETTEEAVIEYCREHLARFKVPKKVIFGPLPKTSTGKLQKYLLRQQMKSASAIG